jgi:hypothetical protein
LRDTTKDRSCKELRSSDDMGTIQRGADATGAAISMSDDRPPVPAVAKSHRRSLVDVMTLGLVADASRKKPWGLKVSDCGCLTAF